MTNAERRWANLRHEGRYVNPAALVAPLPNTVRVKSDGTIALFGDIYTAEATFPPGTDLHIARDARGNMTACSTEDARQIAAKRADDAADDAKRRRHEQAETRRANRDANEQLGIPTQWIPDANPYVSTDWHGTDRPRRREPTYHVRLLDDLHDGRLHRRKGDTLCKANTRWGDLIDRDYRDRYQFEAHRATCRACLKVAARWSDNLSTGGDTT